jgi:hypothetical protein
VHLLRDALAVGGSLVQEEGRSAEQLYGELVSRLVAVERDLVSLPVSYYFADRDPRFELAATMPWLLELAERGLAKDAPPRTRLRARMLYGAIDDFARTTTAFHGVGGSTARRLEAYALDHRRGA